MKLKTPSDIPANWDRLKARRQTTVTVRESNGVEKFKVSWQDAELTSDPVKDWIVTQADGSEYPCKKDIFRETYELFVLGCGDDRPLWRKKELSTLVQVPPGQSVCIETLEGILPEVHFPDYIVIGKKDELYANKWEWAEKNLEFID